MAERRMFAKTIIDSDAFLDMPATSQLLYFHLSMRADDDGFINKPKTIMRMVGSKDDDINLLIAKKFLIPFESGVVVIKHWRIHNYIRNDRYKETVHKDEKMMLELKDNGGYRLKTNDGIPSGYQMETQVRLGKVSIGEEKDNNVSFSNETIQFQLSELLYQSILGNDDKFKKPDLFKWASHIDKLIRIDGRSVDEIKKVIQFASTNDFWKSNILSTSKLRKQFPTLVIQMKRGEKDGINKKPDAGNKKSDWDIEGIIL